MTKPCMSVQQGLEGKEGTGGLLDSRSPMEAACAQPASPLNSVSDLLCVLCVISQASRL